MPTPSVRKYVAAAICVALVATAFAFAPSARAVPGAPTVVTRSPLPGAAGVASDTVVTVVFSEPMDAESLDIVLRRPGGFAVQSTLDYDDMSYAATLRPVGPLESSTLYTVEVNAADDLDGDSLAGSISWTFTTATPAFVENVPLDGLELPTALRFAPDGTVFIAEKSGLVKSFESLEDDTPTIVADLRTLVHNFWDRGLLGLAVPPDYPENNSIYVSYTYDAAIGGSAPRWGAPGETYDDCPTPPGAHEDGCVASGRLSRLFLDASGVAQNEQVLLNDWCIQYVTHSVGNIDFGPDGALYMTGGEGANDFGVDYGQAGDPVNPCGDPPGGAGATLEPPTAEGGALRAQDLRTSGDPLQLGGSVLRLDPETGAANPGNPLAYSDDENEQRVIAMGLRNPFRWAFRPGTDEMFIGDVGWSTHEEVNRVGDVNDAAIENFGWPCYEGPQQNGPYAAAGFDICDGLFAENSAVPPLFAYDHDEPTVPGENCALGGSTTGMRFYEGGNYPDRYDGALFFGDYSRGCIWVMFPGDAEPGVTPAMDPDSVEVFRSPAPGVVDIQVGPGGDLYYVDILGGAIHHIAYEEGNHAPNAVLGADPIAGPLPLTTTLDASASADPDGDSVTYAWDLDDDGAFDDATTPTVNRTYLVAGTVRVRVRVTDGQGASSVATRMLFPGNSLPETVIDTPIASDPWAVGDVVHYSGHATDPEDGTVPAADLDWTILLHHCQSPSVCHTHTVEQIEGAASGSFVVPNHEFPSFLQLTLEATDSQGLSTTDTVMLQPQVTDVTVDADVPGLLASLGSKLLATPFTVPAIVGSSTTISLPSPQDFGGTRYSFANWSDNGARTHDVTVGASPTTFTAATTPSPGVFEFAAGQRALENDGAAVVTVSRTLGAAGPATVSYHTTNGTATAPADFTSVSGTLSFADGERSKTFTVPVVEDHMPEGDETVTLHLSDATGATIGDATGTLTILNSPINAVDDSATTSPNVAVGIYVIGNDQSETGGGTGVVSHTQPSHGEAVCNNAGCTYTPASGYTGTDAFTYVLGDQAGHRDTATVSIGVGVAPPPPPPPPGGGGDPPPPPPPPPGNNAPVAVPDTASTSPGSPVGVYVVGNDYDPDPGHWVGVDRWTQPSYGSVTCSNAGCTYTPNPGYTGTDEFTYTIVDPLGTSATTTVSVGVGVAPPPPPPPPGEDPPPPPPPGGGSNNAPVAVDDSATTTPGNAVGIYVVGNDYDPDAGDWVGVNAWTQPAHGSVACSNAGCTYTPTPGYSGTDSFTYTLVDPHGASDSATVSVGVGVAPPPPPPPPPGEDPPPPPPPNTNNAPVAVNDAASTARNTAVGIYVVGNDYDPDAGDWVGVDSWTQPAHGSVTCSNAGCTYTPAMGYSGTDSFTYTVLDPHGASATATVTVVTS